MTYGDWTTIMPRVSFIRACNVQQLENELASHTKCFICHYQHYPLVPTH
jgi:hypothetical protein